MSRSQVTPPAKANLDETITVTCDREMKAQIEALAENEDRKIGHMARILLREALAHRNARELQPA